MLVERSENTLRLIDLDPVHPPIDRCIANVSDDDNFCCPLERLSRIEPKRPFTIKPGPNNPVGVVWISLSIKGYGIHGTPEPGKVSKTMSHGCIRLTNWDAKKLAAMVEKGTVVDLLG